MPGIPYNFFSNDIEEHFSTFKCDKTNYDVKIDTDKNEFIISNSNSNSNSNSDTRLTRVCPHNGCLLNQQNDKFVCPCHKSTFDKCGNCLKGPACPKSILVNDKQ